MWHHPSSPRSERESEGMRSASILGLIMTESQQLLLPNMRGAALRKSPHCVSARPVSRVSVSHRVSGRRFASNNRNVDDMDKIPFPPPKMREQPDPTYAWTAEPTGPLAPVRKFLRRLLILNPDSVPYVPPPGYRYPAPASQKPRVYSPEMADKSEPLGSIYYYKRGSIYKPHPKGELVVDAASGQTTSPSMLEEQARRLAEQQEIEKLKAEGKTPPPQPPMSSSPVVEVKAFDLDPSNLTDFRKDMHAQFPPREQRHYLRNTASYYYCIM